MEERALHDKSRLKQSTLRTAIMSPKFAAFNEKEDQTVVRSILLYGYETWSVRVAGESMLEVFDTWVVRGAGELEAS